MNDIDREIQLDRDLEELKKQESIYKRFVEKQDVIGALFDLFEINEEKYNKALRHSNDKDKDAQYKIMLNFIDYLRNVIKSAPLELEDVKELITDVDTGDLMEDWVSAYWPLFGNVRKKKKQEQLERRLKKALYEFKFNLSSFTPTKKEA